VRSFGETQDRHFVAADAAHYRWATEDPAFAPVARLLYAPQDYAITGVR